LTTSLCGLPFFSGFYSKDLILEVMRMGYLNFYIYIIFYVSIGLTVCYRVRLSYYFILGNFNFVFDYFWLPHQQMGSTAGTFAMPDFNLSSTTTHRNFVRIGYKNFFRKNHDPLPSIIFAPGKNI
jgi:NADH:ubiquinone oxidoreductase subunit 5 (subunit L)/multisubunit Na+/H+ antiporter MnhA subunit